MKPSGGGGGGGGGDLLDLLGDIDLGGGSAAPSMGKYHLNPSNAKATFIQSTGEQRPLKTI